MELNNLNNYLKHSEFKNATTSLNKLINSLNKAIDELSHSKNGTLTELEQFSDSEMVGSWKSQSTTVHQ
jgi:flagellar capping protein FliD